MTGGTLLTIGELARLTGLTVKTVRFWSDEGLLPPEGRTRAGYRLYGRCSRGWRPWRRGRHLSLESGRPSKGQVANVTFHIYRTVTR
jgi:hypothetical protein